MRKVLSIALAALLIATMLLAACTAPGQDTAMQKDDATAGAATAQDVDSAVNEEVPENEEFVEIGEII